MIRLSKSGFAQKTSRCEQDAICSWPPVAAFNCSLTFWSVTILIFHGWRLRAEGANRTDLQKFADLPFGN